MSRQEARALMDLLEVLKEQKELNIEITAQRVLNCDIRRIKRHIRESISRLEKEREFNDF